MIGDLLPAALLDRLDRDGGFTVEARTGAPLVRGIAVCLQPSVSWTFRRAEWHDDAVRRWIERHAASARTPAIGGWLDDDTVWLDHVHVVPRVLGPVAAALGRRRHQVAVFDLSRRLVVRLRSATAPAPLAPPPRDGS
jgi:hypothetical protein